MYSHRVNRIILGLVVLGSAGFVALPVFSEEKKPVPLAPKEKGDCPLEDRGTVPFFLNRRIQEIQPTAKELRFDAIGWVSGIREAERLARENGRPVFLFSNVGQMDLGRC